MTCLKESPWLQSRLKPSPKIVFLKVTVRSEEICSASAFAKSVAPSLSLWGGCHDLSKCNADSLLRRKKHRDYSPEYVQQVSLLSLHLKTACG